KDNVDGAFRPHDGNLGRGVGVVDVGANVLAGHDVVGAPIRLAGNDGDFGHGGLGEGVQQLGTVGDDAAPLLGRPRKKARHVDEGDEGNVEAVAEAHEAGRLDRSRNVQDAGQEGRLVGHHPDAAAVEAGEADHNVFGKVLLHFEEVSVV